MMNQCRGTMEKFETEPDNRITLSRILDWAVANKLKSLIYERGGIRRRVYVARAENGIQDDLHMPIADDSFYGRGCSGLSL